MRRLRVPITALATTGLLVMGCGSSDTTGTVPPPKVPPGLSIESGNTQLGAVGSLLLQPLAVTLGDASGNPIQGTQVAWSVSEGGGTLAANASLTDVLGRATVTFQLGDSAGTNLVVASVSQGGGDSVSFSSQAVVPTAIANFQGDMQAGRITQTLLDSLRVRVTLADGSGVPGVLIVWDVAGGSGSPSAASAVSDGFGIVSVAYTLGSTPGIDTITATATDFNLGPVTMTASGSPAVTVGVDMFGIAFVAPDSSDDVSILLGDTLRWVNLDAVIHTSTSTEAPAGGSSFDSDIMAQGDSFEFVPDVRGRWIYFCEIHPAIMVDATITVQ